jgi:RNA polymerase sigma-70 factor (ECF subfamily)
LGAQSGSGRLLPEMTATLSPSTPPRFVRESAAAPRALDASRLPDHLDRLYRTARAITGSAQEAEDLVSETMVRVLSRPRRVRGEDDLGYLTQCLRNTWSDTLRTRSRRPRTACMPDDFEHADAGSCARAHARAEANEVLAAVARIAAPHRDAILLVDVAGMTYAEAAKQLGVPRGTIMSRLSRGRAAVLEELAA